MACRLAAASLVFCILAFIPPIEAYCPPLTKASNERDPDAPTGDHFTVNSQADADQLKTCDIFKGELIIRGTNASGPLIIDGPRRIEGQLTMALYSGDTNSLFTSVSMTSLSAVAGRTDIYTRWLQGEGPAAYLGALDFPALQTVEVLSARSLASVRTLNLPLLEYAGSISLFNAPKLDTINAPKLKSLRNMQLSLLPSLKTAESFAPALKGLVEKIELWNTGLTSLSFPHINVLSDLTMWENFDLATLSLPSLTRVTGGGLYARGRGRIMTRDNNPNFVLSLPKLATVTGSLDISGLGGIEIPELRVIGKNPRATRGLLLGSLYVGANDNGWRFRCVDCPHTHLTTFSAPKLRKVEGRIAFDSNPDLLNINFPVLKSAKEFRINSTAALVLENGISMPSLTHVENVHIIDTESRCDFWEQLYCGGRVVGNYSCGRGSEVSNSKTEIWPAFPPPCAVKEELGFSRLGETYDIADHLEWLSDLVFEDCYVNMNRVCVRGYSFTKGFLVTMGLFLVAARVMWWVIKRRMRHQIEQEIGGKEKVVTD
ncbi:hypothetical protein N431DRAFT_479568 [Stipitochalara longipes BDJ]|nr:hypothetical protein N431DRAFT_479568 [Stipitochalara longipes BDJ]